MFEMKLALALSRSLSELYLSVDSQELTLWQGFHSIYGLPYDRIEACIAMSGAANCQVQGSKVSPADLMPKFQRPTTPEQERAKRQLFCAWAESHNARILKKLTR